MTSRILTAALALTACTTTLASAQQPAMDAPHREGSWEFSLGGGFLMLDSGLRDFLGSGAPDVRFADETSPGRATPTGVARVGYNFTRNIGLSGSVSGAFGSGVRYLNLTEAVTYTVNLNATTSPFILIGTELTRIDGRNDRVTHSTWGAHAGLGIRHMVSENLALRVEGRMRFAGYREAPMDRTTTYSPLVQGGISYFVGGRKPQAQVPAVVAAAPCSVCAPQRMARVDTLRSIHVDTIQLAGISAEQVILRVQFRTDRAELLPISLPVLNAIAAAIRETPNSRWQVEGHTDSVGTDADNKVLSQARAQTVVDYLVSQGVSRSIMVAVGFGSERPVFSNVTDAGRAENRRVQLRQIPLPPTVRVP